MLTSQLITTGLSLGILHVLAGPDHLSALATLSVGNSWKAMSLGVRWGLGHSAGLVVVAVIFISLKGEMDLTRIGQFCNTILGIFMITIGLYGTIGAFRTYGEKRNKRDLDLDRSSSYADGDSYDVTSQIVSTATRSNSIRKMNDLHVDKDDTDADAENVQSCFDCSSDHDHDHDHGHEQLQKCIYRLVPYVDMHDSTTQKVVSFLIGVLHGVAGPGAILGVLPAVEMQSWRASFCYLSSFIVASTLSMGAFAALYGELTKRLGSTAESVELALRVFSSSLSIVVGFVWLVLSLLGKLDGYFH
jgi:ABC-type nickel/cobalt efflux system permease component RcnA